MSYIKLQMSTENYLGDALNLHQLTKNISQKHVEVFVKYNLFHLGCMKAITKPHKTAKWELRAILIGRKYGTSIAKSIMTQQIV